MNQRGDSLRVLGVGEAFKEAVGSAKDGKKPFRAGRRRTRAVRVAFAGFAEEHA